MGYNKLDLHKISLNTKSRAEARFISWMASSTFSGGEGAAYEQESHLPPAVYALWEAALP